MWPSPFHRRTRCPRLRRQGGFTLFETVLVVAMLTAVSLGIMAMQPQVFKTQTTGRDQLVGSELMRGCAERLLAVRRYTGYATVALADANGNAITTCSSATCTATIIVAKSAAPAATLTPITLQLSAY